jgi:diguanylate cyclase (GGDEF)-like protein/PAS domain S-box-containing protein
MDELYKRILETLPQGIYTTDLNRRILYWNKAAEALTGHLGKNILGISCQDNILVHTDDQGSLLCRSDCPLAATMKDGQPRSSEVFLLHKDGHRKPVMVKTFPLTDASGAIIGGIETFTDSSMPLEALRRIEEYREAALIDHLTGCGNRRYLTEEIERRLEALKKGEKTFGLLFFDLDKFKTINDSYLHSGGDMALQMVARTLMGNLRSDDFVSRWGGDEFVVLVSDVAEPEMLKIANKLVRLIAASRVRLKDERSFAVGVSMGAAIAHPEDTMESLMNRADQAMYAEKHRKAQPRMEEKWD